MVIVTTMATTMVVSTMMVSTMVWAMVSTMVGTVVSISMSVTMSVVTTIIVDSSHVSARDTIVGGGTSSSTIVQSTDVVLVLPLSIGPVGLILTER